MIRTLIYIISLALSVQSAAKNINPIYIYNWANYIPSSTITEFENREGIKVIYDVFNSEEMLDAKLLSGHTGYDIVFPTNGPFLPNQIKNGLYKELDIKQLKNYKNIDPKILKILRENDPSNKYIIPFMWTATGIGYNLEKIKSIDPKAPLDSLDLIFNPEYAEKFSKCGIAWCNFPMEAVSMAMLYNGDDPNNMNPDTLKKAQDTLQKVRKYVKYISTNDVYSDYLANGSVCLVLGWTGEISMSKEKFSIDPKSQSKNIFYIIPKEGFIMSLDTIAMPADSSNLDSYKLIDFLLEPTVATSISKYSHHTSTSLHVKEKESMFTKDEISRAHLMKPQPIAYLRKITKIWNNVLTNMD